MRKLQILGTGCPKCKRLAQAAEEAAKELGIEYELERISDLNEMMKFGVMMTPALVIDGRVVAAGKVPSAGEIRKMLESGGPQEEA